MGRKMTKELLLIIIGILVIIILLLVSYLYGYKKQLKLLAEQMQFIEDEETNIRLVSFFNAKEINQLVILVNRVIGKYRNATIETVRVNRNFRESITSISHDIRTPLTSLRGYIQLMRKETEITEKQERYIKIMESRFDAVQRMLNQLFEYARIENGEITLQMEKVNIQNVLYDVLSNFYDEFSKQKEEPAVTICEEIMYINADKNAIFRVIENILSNALRHGTGGYGVELLKEKDTCIINISNLTDSIEETDVERIFERFYTTDKSRTKKGTGLGLAIAKKFTEQMGGNIEAKLEGDKFMIRITFHILAKA
ncbi:MAG: HAMP domain-containing histidine kinase [Lachnospiraceae bacterium]|nr:HAMP domain-containing histidine kinase [Lachnospiraceae bacterium]